MACLIAAATAIIVLGALQPLRASLGQRDERRPCRPLPSSVMSPEPLSTETARFLDSRKDLFEGLLRTHGYDLALPMAWKFEELRPPEYANNIVIRVSNIPTNDRAIVLTVVLDRSSEKKGHLIVVQDGMVYEAKTFSKRENISLFDRLASSADLHLSSEEQFIHLALAYVWLVAPGVEATEACVESGTRKSRTRVILKRQLSGGKYRVSAMEFDSSGRLFKASETLQ
jgi:hypothetical protein